MTVWVTNQHGLAGTAGLAQQFTARVARRLGYQELSIPILHNSKDTRWMTRVDGAIPNIENNDVVILQSPLWHYWEFEDLFTQAVHLRAKHVKLIIFIHDIEPAEYGYYDRKYMLQWINLYNQADGLIMANKHTEEFLRAYGLKIPHEQITYHKIWDNLCSFDQLTSVLKQNNKQIQFAGDAAKFKFVEEWPSGVQPLINYSKPHSSGAGNVKYMGKFPNQILLLLMHQLGGFGLLWEANDDWYSYMKINTSFKLGAYLSAGLPVIAHRGIAQEDFIINNHLGICVDSLRDAITQVDQLDDNHYLAMAQNVARVGQMTREGRFTEWALVQAVYRTLLHSKA